MAKKTVEELVAAVREYAVSNYNKDGWDYVVECWADDEIAIEIDGCRTDAGAIKRMKAAVKPLNERRAEVRAEIF